MPNIECEQCGGTDFYKEAGFYFCSGCQIQSQEVQEYIYDEWGVAAGDQSRVRTKKVQSQKSGEKIDNKITSWECYNYILLALTEELINLGANKDLKSVVRILWLRYLEKLQVFKRGQDVLPKLQAVGSGLDTEIVYGKLARRKRKRNKSSSSEMDLKSLDSLSVKRERAKSKRALIRQHHEEVSQKSQGTSSLHNETFTSLQTGSEKSSKNETPISYNKFASRELKKVTRSYYHWRKHCRDYEQNLRCHKMSYRKISYKYRTSPYILSLNKLYAILYIGLLILKDKIQLSDMLRFIKEGHLSFNYYTHLLPEEFAEKTLNFRNFKKNSVFANAPFRSITSDMSAFLEIDWYIPCPDLAELCERYCKELNLPNEICDCAKNIISRSAMKMSYLKRPVQVPNYEGRILSVILFVLKLLFGFDDVTEFYLGQYSDILNQSRAISPKMFDVVEWLKYIEYRNIVLSGEHFPSHFTCNDNINNVELALSFMSKKQYVSQIKLGSTKDKYGQLLNKLKDNMREPPKTDFPVSLTPFRDYSNFLAKEKKYLVLAADFSNDSLVHVLCPNPFLSIVNKGQAPQTVNGGANSNLIFEKIVCPAQENQRVSKEKRDFVTAKLSFDGQKKKETLNETESEIDCDIVKEDFRIVNESVFRKNMHRLGKQHIDDGRFNWKRLRKNLKLLEYDYSSHFNPYEAYWMRIRMKIDALSKKECSKFLSTFPYNFKLVFKECVRIAQQTEQDLLAEYQMTELFLVHAVNFDKDNKNAVKEGPVAKFLTKFAEMW